MNKLKITVIKKVIHQDLIEKFENKIDNPCNMNLFDTWIIEDINEKPNNFCLSAWMTLYPFLLTLSSNGSDIYNGWMKDKRSCIVSCNDGCRPVSFLIEVVK